MTQLVVFASGNGTNAENLIRFFSDPQKEIRVGAVFCNNPDAYVLERAKRLGTPCFLIRKEDFFADALPLMAKLRDCRADYLILAGFLWKMPEAVIDAYPDRILNIHPALLPRYGGKGMYGRHVHQAVLAAKEKESGISIHLVDKDYDHGAILFRANCRIDPGESPDSLAAKIHRLEQKHFPEVVEQYVLSRQKARNLQY